MPEKRSYEYAVIRVVPRVEREEFLNVGVILYCKRPEFIGTLISMDEERLRAFCGKTDIPQVREYLEAIDRISAGGPGSGPIGQLDAGSRFRWLTATRSTVVQTSKVHGGLTADPAATLAALHAKLVL
ncbi:DUF3037 domain-containing protein [Chitinophaga lutea]